MDLHKNAMLDQDFLDSESPDRAVAIIFYIYILISVARPTITELSQIDQCQIKTQCLIRIFYAENTVGCRLQSRYNF